MSVVPLPPSIDKTGKTDVTVPLNAWLASLPNGATASLPAGAVLRVEGGATIDHKDGFGVQTPADAPAQLISRNATTGSNRDVLKINGGSNIDVINVVARGGHPAAGATEAAYADGIYEGMHNIAAYGVQRLNLVDVNSYDSRADLFYMARLKIPGKSATRDGRAAYQWCTDVNVDGGHYERGGRQAFTVSAGENIDLRPATVGEVPRHIIDIEPNLAAYNGAAGVKLHDAKILNAHLGLMALSGCGPIDDIELNTLDCATALDVWAQEGKGSPAGGPRRTGFTMVACTSKVVAGNSIGGVARFDKWDGINLGFNRQPVDPDRKPPMTLAAVTTNCTGINIRWNDLPGAAGQYRLVDSLP